MSVTESKRGSWSPGNARAGPLDSSFRENDEKDNVIQSDQKPLAILRLLNDYQKCHVIIHYDDDENN